MGTSLNLITNWLLKSDRVRGAINRALGETGWSVEGLIIPGGAGVRAFGHGQDLDHVALLLEEHLPAGQHRDPGQANQDESKNSRERNTPFARPAGPHRRIRVGGKRNIFQAKQRRSQPASMGGHAELAERLDDEHLQTDKPESGASHDD
jgi:hypothetical protein